MAEKSKDLKKTVPQPGIVFLRPVIRGFSGKNSKIADFPIKPVISVSKKVFKTAVLRNKAKRKVREAYRLAVKGLNHDTLHSLPPVRIDAKEGVFKMRQAEIQDAIAAYLKK